MNHDGLLSTLYFLLVCCAALAVPASAQHFKQVTGSLNQVAAGRTEVFGINSSGQVFRYNPGTKAFVQIPGSLSQVAVGGGTLSQRDEVWGLDLSNQIIYHFNYGTKTFVRVPGSNFEQITVGEGDQDKCHPYEVWALDINLVIYRYNYCSKAWDTISGYLLTIATGAGDVWGINATEQVYHYDFGVGGWVQVQLSFAPLLLTVGVNDVWALGFVGDIWRYDPSSATFVQVPGQLSQIAVGGDGVWGTNSSLQIYRFDSSTESFLQVPGSLRQPAVGYGAGVWAIDSSDRVYTFVRP